VRLDGLSELEVRLAYEQGLLRGPSITPYQRWALEYMMSFKRWFLTDVQRSALKDLLFMLDPQRWKELFLPRPEVEDDGVPITEDDLDDIGKLLDELDRGGTVVASQLPGAGEDGWY